MHHREGTTIKGRRTGASKSASVHQSKTQLRYTVGLPASLAHQVERYAQTVDMSMSKAISALVSLGLQNQENRKREFFKRLKENLAEDDPKQEDRLVDEFRNLILGR
jgi:hypothetical protein